MSCGVNIPLSSVVEAILNDYADVFVAEILKNVNLAGSTIDNGTLTNVTIRGGLTVDDTTKAALCSALQDCIAAKIQDELGCERDNHVVDFKIDKANDKITILLKFGEAFHISKQELADWIGSTGGGIKSGVLVDEDGKIIIRVTNNDNKTVDIDVSGLKDLDTNTYVVSGTVSGKTLTLVRTDGKPVNIDMSAFSTDDTNTYPTEGKVINGTTIRITMNDGKYFDIDASTLIPNNTDSPYIVSGVFVERDGGYWLDFTRNDKTQVNVDMTDIINKITSTLFGRIMGQGYRIKTENSHYTTQTEDFDGFTIIRANRNGDQTITITKPDDSFVGKALIIRKTNGDVGTFVTLKADTDVTISPADSTPLRRVGSSATLVYTGEGNWDVFGELP